MSVKLYNGDKFEQWFLYQPRVSAPGRLTFPQYKCDVNIVFVLFGCITSAHADKFMFVVMDVLYLFVDNSCPNFLPSLVSVNLSGRPFVVMF